MTIAELSIDQKRQFLKDGFIVLPGIVPRTLTAAARRHIYLDASKHGLRRHSHDTEDNGAFSNLVNQSALGDVIRNTMGPYDPPERGFAAILYPEPESEVPNYGWSPHIDGWAYFNDLPGTPREVDSWKSPRTEHFGTGDASTYGDNLTPFFQDPECRLSIGSFTAFVGVALNDQTHFGSGNLCLLKGAHAHVENFFKKQRDAGGVIGPEGPGWPRLAPLGNGSVGMVPMPDEIRDQFMDEATTTEDGNVWLKPTPVLLDEGDAVIALHACPHGASRNHSADPRMNVYFRLRRQQPGRAKVRGDSDHPDRGWDGEFLEYPNGFDPWQSSIDAMCDHWSEWDGMQDVLLDSPQ